MQQNNNEKGLPPIAVDDSPTVSETSETLNSNKCNNTTQSEDVQEVSEQQDNLRGRHFAYVVYPESAPEDWVEQLRQTGLSFVVSPLHDKDVNPTGEPKKPHYHVIISWTNPTTYRSARGLCETILNCPRPQILKNPTGMYRYLTHKDNPEKYQYEETPKAYNGWVKPLDSAEVTALMEEITEVLYLQDCTEYGELVMECQDLGAEYFDVVSSHTYYFDRLCTGYRHKPVKTLMRLFNRTQDPEKQKRITELINQYIEQGE